MPSQNEPNDAPGVPVADSASILIHAQAFVDRKYVARADDRQREMGLAYIEAERQDLAREITRFVLSEIAALPQVVDLLNASTFEGLSLVRQPAGGFVASLMTGLDTHSPWEFSTTPCGAIEKCLRKWGQVQSGQTPSAPAPISPPSAPSVVIAPPPY